VAGREPSFTTNNCASNFGVYQADFNALTTFGTDVGGLSGQYLSDPNLNNYKSSYFAYYTAVSDFMSNQTQALFLSFLSPFETLVEGSQCTFLTESLDSLVATACNNNFPYVYVITIFTICMSITFFFLMAFSYYLTPRMEFYEFLEGDFDNYDEFGRSDDDLVVEMTDMTARTQKLMETPGASPARYSPTPYPEKYSINNPRYDGKYDPEDPRYRRLEGSDLSHPGQ
jgi:hypothetical protein